MRSAPVVAAVIFGTTVTGVAVAATTPGKVTRTCASNRTGALRAASHCGKGEHRVSVGGVSGYQRAVGTYTTPGAGVFPVDAVCPDGLVVLGGGASLAQSAEGPAWQPDDARLVSSAPVNDSTWQVAYYVPTAGIIQSWAICAQPS